MFYIFLIRGIWRGGILKAICPWCGEAYWDDVEPTCCGHGISDWQTTLKQFLW